MIKKLFLASILSLALSFQTKSDVNSHSGFYIGSYLAYVSLNGQLINDFSMSGERITKNDFGTNSPAFGVSVGYFCKTYVTDIYLGLDVFSQYENLKSTNIFSHFDKKYHELIDFETIFKRNHSYGVAQKIGYLYKDSLFFLKSGFTYMENIKGNTSKKTKGFLLGMGMDYDIDLNLSIGFEFVYEKYNSIDLIIPSYGIIKYKPTRSTSKIGFKYNF